MRLGALTGIVAAVRDVGGEVAGWLTGKVRMAARPRLPRSLHPGAWWVWAIGMATAASATTNPVLCALVLAVVAFVVTRCRSDDSWALGLKAYFVMAFVVIGIRVVFQVLLNGHYGGHVLFTLPRVPLPRAAAGIRIGGPVALEGLLAALYDGLRLATLLVCLGAANLLANPKRLLKAMPSALIEVGTAVTVALSIAPQLIESGRRIRRARRLRGDDDRSRRFRRLLHRVAVPVLTDALDRSLLLGAAMDSRGYGRRGSDSRRSRRVSAVLLLGGLAGVCVGAYGILDATTPRALGLPMLIGGVLVAGSGFVLSGRRVQRTRYRPDPWSWPEWAVAACGVCVGVGMYTIGRIDPDRLNPSLQPLRWPTISILPVLLVLLGALPVLVTPPVPRSVSPSAERVGTSGLGVGTHGDDGIAGDRRERPAVEAVS